MQTRRPYRGMGLEQSMDWVARAPTHAQTVMRLEMVESHFELRKSEAEELLAQAVDRRIARRRGEGRL